MSILDCWRRSKYVLFLHNLITLLGNIVLLHAFAPMLVKTNPNITALSYATIIGIDVAIFSQILLLGIGFLYFKTCHPWARLLKAELSIGTVSETSDQSSQICNSKNDIGKLSKSEPDLFASNGDNSQMKRSISEPELRQPNSTEGSAPSPMLVHLVEADNLNSNVTVCTHL